MLNVSFKNFVFEYLSLYCNHILYTAYVGEYCTGLFRVSIRSS